MITPSRPATHLPRAPTSGSGGGADRDDRVRARTLVDGAGTRAGRKEVRPIARLVRRAEPAQRVSRSIPTSTARSVRSSSNRSAVRRRRGSLGSPRTRRTGRRGRSRAASGRGAGVPPSGGLNPPRVPSPIPDGVALRPPRLVDLAPKLALPAALGRCWERLGPRDSVRADFSTPPGRSRCRVAVGTQPWRDRASVPAGAGPERGGSSRHS